MSLVEMVIVAIVVTATVFLTVRFYLRGGICDRYISYGTPVLGIAAVACKRAMAEETLLVLLLCTVWGAYLIATNLFNRCKTEQQFRSAFRPKVAFLYGYLLFTVAGALAIKERTFVGIVFCVLSGLLWLSFAVLLRRRPGDIRFYQNTLTLLICLWVFLAALLASGHLYNFSQGRIAWRIPDLLT